MCNIYSYYSLAMQLKTISGYDNTKQKIYRCYFLSNHIKELLKQNIQKYPSSKKQPLE